MLHPFAVGIKVCGTDAKTGVKLFDLKLPGAQLLRQHIRRKETKKWQPWAFHPSCWVSVYCICLQHKVSEGEGWVFNV